MVFGIDNADETTVYPECYIDVENFKTALASSPPILSPMTQQVEITHGNYGYTSIVFNQENGDILGLDETSCLDSADGSFQGPLPHLWESIQ